VQLIEKTKAQKSSKGPKNRKKTWKTSTSKVKQFYRYFGAKNIDEKPPTYGKGW